MSSKQKVNNRCLYKSGKNCCMKNNLTTQMENYYDESHKLYKRCCEDRCDGIVDPVNWIFNQDKMRVMWETYKQDVENKTEIIKNAMLNNSFSKYMDFMYDTYPTGFGNKLKECYDNKINFDGAKIFYNLKNK